MPSFVILGNFTEQGAKDMKNLKTTVEAAKEAISGAGGRMIFYYTTLGEYDFVSVAEVPDAETATRVILGIGAPGTCARRRCGRSPRTRRGPSPSRCRSDGSAQPVDHDKHSEQPEAGSGDARHPPQLRGEVAGVAGARAPSQ